VDPATKRRFEEAVLPHLDAGYNFARYLTRNPDDAADVLQEAAVRAFRFFGGFKGGNVRTWLLTIVRNTAYSWMNSHRGREIVTMPEELGIDRPLEPFSPVPWERLPDDPETRLLLAEDRAALFDVIDRLSPEFREVLVLREIEELSYREIAEVTAVPVGTVMSRLARARRQVQDGWRRHVAFAGGAR
jgi:RNA polymerase sigma-70 factor (ECF subfamily)